MTELETTAPPSDTGRLANPRTLGLVLFAHLVLWTLVPALLNPNLPLDVVEALAWGREWELGYAKHPPLSAWMAEGVTAVLGRQPWGMYLLSSLCVTGAIALVYATARRFVDPTRAMISALLLEGIYYHNFTTPEFNVNICIMPVLAGMAYGLIRGLESRRVGWWALSGACAGLAVLGKYTAAMMIGPIVLITLLHPDLRRCFRGPGPYVGLLVGGLVMTPHLWWIDQSSGQTLGYATARAGVETVRWYDHAVRPLGFTAKMIGVSLPMLILAWPLMKPGGAQQDGSDTPPDAQPEVATTAGVLSPSARRWLIRTLAFGGLASFAVMALVTGWKIRTMWAGPMFLFMGLMLVHARPMTLSPINLRRFGRLFVALFLLTPIGYAGLVLLQPISGEAKRVHFPGHELAHTVSDAWHTRYDRPLPIAAGEIWVASCVGYYAPDRPTAYLNVDPAGAAWCDDERLNREGGVLLHVLYKKLPVDAPPDEQWADWERRFPHLQRQDRLILQQQTLFGDPKPAVIDWAIIPPADMTN
ncbi:MAG: glycosyltransferase family 39 protein [Planctomycetota bacterium]